MSATTIPPRLNIYLDDEDLRVQIKIAAARAGATLSAYCLDAVRARLASEGYLDASPDRPPTPRAAARQLDRLRRRIGPIGVPVSRLIAEGRRR